MKVFVGFGYNKKDKWINELVIPFISTLGCQVLTGEDMQGEALDDGVISRIQEADVCIGFLTKREKTDKGVYTTHRWVIEEIGVAISNKKPTFEIREKGVDPQGGIAGKFQRFEFNDKALLLFEILKFIVKEKQKRVYKTFMFSTKEFVDEVNPYIANDDVRCTYSFFVKPNKFYQEEETKIISFEGKYSTILKIPDGEEASLKISVKIPGGIIWKADYFPIDIFNVKLVKQN
jgi:hypothetical protein